MSGEAFGKYRNLFKKAWQSMSIRILIVWLIFYLLYYVVAAIYYVIFEPVYEAGEFSWWLPFLMLFVLALPAIIGIEIGKRLRK